MKKEENKEKEKKERWEKLLEPRTFRERSKKNDNDSRNEFESDYSRIISSSSFRRLQDKAQVFPLKRGDFVRTRLTHSLEVANIGRSLGINIERKLNLEGKISTILATAGLVHDLGNPPFGHYGEYAIQRYFEKKIEESEFSMSEQEKEDLKNFDGNVQTFRILKKLHYLKDEHGYNLTYPLLATIIKYPCNSLEGNKGKEAERIEYKKFGYFESEKDAYEEINEVLELRGKRHPLTFLLEAADDIAYCVADIEDGAQKKLITLEKIKQKIKQKIEEKIEPASDKTSEEVEELIKLKEKIEELEKEDKTENKSSFFKNKLIIQKLKIYVQGRMTEEVVNYFVKKEENFLKGEEKEEILKNSKVKLVREVFSDLTKENIFNSKEVIENEILSYEIIKKLLSVFVEAELDIVNNGENASKQSEKIVSLISENYKYIHDNYEKDGNRYYNIFKLCVDFVSGMTDNYALDLFKKMSAIKL